MPKASFFFAACLLATILFAFNAHSTPIILPSAAAICMLISMGVWQAEAARFTLTGKQLASLDSVLVTSNCGLHDDGVIYTGMNLAGTAIRSAGFFYQTIQVRGNHDDERSASAILCGRNMETSPNDVFLHHKFPIMYGSMSY
jgi:hypothetical protein